MLTDKAVKAAKPAPGNRYRKLADQGGLHLFSPSAPFDRTGSVSSYPKDRPTAR